MTNLIFEVAASGRHAGVCASDWVDVRGKFAFSKLKEDGRIGRDRDEKLFR